MTADDEADLRLPDARQVEVVRSAVYQAARGNGLGRDRAAAVADAAASHLVGRLRQNGYAVRWVSSEARTTLESARRVHDPPLEAGE